MESDDRPVFCDGCGKRGGTVKRGRCGSRHFPRESGQTWRDDYCLNSEGGTFRFGVEHELARKGIEPWGY